MQTLFVASQFVEMIRSAVIQVGIHPVESWRKQTQRTAVRLENAATKTQVIVASSTLIRQSVEMLLVVMQYAH